MVDTSNQSITLSYETSYDNDFTTWLSQEVKDSEKLEKFLAFEARDNEALSEATQRGVLEIDRSNGNKSMIMTWASKTNFEKFLERHGTDPDSLEYRNLLRKYWAKKWGW
jgi:hypothetical protein